MNQQQATIEDRSMRKAFLRMRANPSRRIVKRWLNTVAQYGRKGRKTGEWSHASKSGACLRGLNKAVVLARRIAV